MDRINREVVSVAEHRPAPDLALELLAVPRQPILLEPEASASEGTTNLASITRAHTASTITVTGALHTIRWQHVLGPEWIGTAQRTLTTP